MTNSNINNKFNKIYLNKYKNSEMIKKTLNGNVENRIIFLLYIQKREKTRTNTFGKSIYIVYYNANIYSDK